jgi:hypothetical protein
MLQNKIGKGCSPSSLKNQKADGTGPEDLKTQLEKQQETATAAVEARASPPSQERDNPDNEGVSGASSTDNTEIPDTTSTTHDLTGDIFQWPAPGNFQLPMIHTEPWGCFETSYTSSPFSSLPLLEGLHDLGQTPTESDLLITPMMHNDL